MDARLSLVSYLMATSGYKVQVKRIASLSSDILRNPQVLEGIASYQSPHFFRTLLMYAVKKRNVAHVKFLLELGADIRACDKDGNAALYYAILSGHLEIFQFLCDKGAALDTSNKIGFTPLHYTSMLDHPDMTAILIEKGVSLDTECIYTPLMDACEKGRNKIVRLLCEAGANLDPRDDRGATALNYATARGSSEIVQYLCDKGAILDLENHERNTPLQLACINGDLKIVRILSAAGAVPNQSHLYNAICNGHTELVRFLLEADISPHDYWRIAPKTFLHIACEHGHYKIVCLLIDAGMRLDAVTHERMTPLMLACKGGYTKIVRLLIANGAGLDLQEQRGRTALHTVCGSFNIVHEEARTKIVNILVDAGAASDLKATDGSTPFSITALAFGQHPFNQSYKALVVYFANLDSQA